MSDMFIYQIFLGPYIWISFQLSLLVAIGISVVSWTSVNEYREDDLDRHSRIMNFVWLICLPCFLWSLFRQLQHWLAMLW